MKHFLKNIITGLLIVVVSIILLNTLYYKKSENEENKKFKELPPHFDIANTGSSHGNMSFVYDKYDNWNCANLALNGQNMHQDYLILQTYQDRIDENTTVFIVVTYMTYLGNDESYEELVGPRYYGIVEPRFIKDYNLLYDICLNHLPILNAADRVIDVTKDRIFNEPLRTYEPFKGDMRENAIGEVSQILSDNKQESKIFYNDLEQSIKLVQGTGATVILVGTPVTSEFTEEMNCQNDKVIPMFYENTSRLSEKFGVEFWDYSNDSRVLDDYSYFFDSHHLSDSGAELFTSIIIDDLNEKYNKNY